MRHRASAASSRPSASGSTPLRRSSQLPSSAAISAGQHAAVVVRGDRREAPAADRRHALPLGLDPAARLGVVGGPRQALPRRHAPGARGRPGRPREASLRDRAERRSPTQAEPVEPARCEDHRVEPALAALAEPGVDVPAERLDGEPRLEREELSPPARRCRPDPHAGTELARAAQRVTRILARRVGADGQPVRVSRRHVLRRMDGDVDSALEQRLLELLDEHPAAADLAERTRPVAVAGRGDRNERDLDAGPAQRIGGALGLGQREPTAARPDAKQHDTGRSGWVAGTPHAAARAAGCGQRRSGPREAGSSTRRARGTASRAFASSPNPNRCRTASA